MTRKLLCALLALASTHAVAQLSPDSPMVRALRDGRASAPVSDTPGSAAAVKRIKEHTKREGDVTTEFFRVHRFREQPKCGRVVFGLYQKSSGTFWGQFGGQLNVCEDGAPPRRQCGGHRVLVSPFTPCADGTAPVETAEVKAAIDRAVANGSLTAERYLAQQAKERAPGERAK